MEMARKITSLVNSLRRKSKIKVRQPLEKAMVAILNDDMRKELSKVQDLVMNE